MPRRLADAQWSAWATSPSGWTVLQLPPKSSKTGTVDQRPSGLWRVRVRIGGVQRSLPGGPWRTEQEARDALALFNAQRVLAEHAGQDVGLLLARPEQRPAPIPSEVRAEMLLGEVYKRSLVGLRGGYEGRSRDRRTFERVINGENTTPKGGLITGRLAIGKMPISHLDRETFDRWLGSLQRNPDNPDWNLSVSTTAKWARHLDQLLNWAVNAEYIAKNPMATWSAKQLNATVKSSRTPRYVLTLAEAYLLREAALTDVEGLLWDVILFAGLRSQEARALRPESLVGSSIPMLDIVDAVDSDGGRPVLKSTKTPTSERRVPIPRPLMAQLKTRARQVGPGNFLFPGPSGGLMRTEYLNRRFRLTREQAGLLGLPGDRQPGRRKPPTPHGLRATAASWLSAAGVPVVEAQAFLGHASAAMTQDVYTTVGDFGDEHPIAIHCRARGYAAHQVMEVHYFALLAGLFGYDLDFKSGHAEEFDGWLIAYDDQVDVLGEVTAVLKDARERSRDREDRVAARRARMIEFES